MINQFNLIFFMERTAFQFFFLLNFEVRVFVLFLDTHTLNMRIGEDKSRWDTIRFDYIVNRSKT